MDFFLFLMVVGLLTIWLVSRSNTTSRRNAMEQRLQAMEARLKFLEQDTRQRNLKKAKKAMAAVAAEAAAEQPAEKSSEVEITEAAPGSPVAAPPPLPETEPEKAFSTAPAFRPQADTSLSPVVAKTYGRTAASQASDAAAATPVSSPAPPSIPWRKILEAMQLLPPRSTDSNTEVRLAIWWTTRVGAVLLVIAGVFLGVYVSQDSPALRLLCLGLISAGVVVAGLWLEKRYRAFGRIVGSAGLGMCFVTAFAASAFETTRVIESPTIGVLLQLLAIVGLIAWSLWKDDSTVATMALVCGYIACGFSQSHDLAYFVVAGLLLLAAAGSVLLVLKRWPQPAIVALGGSWLGFLLLAVLHWRTSLPAERPGAVTALLCFAGLTLIFHVAQILFRQRHPKLATSRRLRIGAISNTSLAVVTLYLAGRLVYPDHLATFYLTFAALIFGFAAWHYRPGVSHDPKLAQAFFLKSMALLALFFVAHFDGPVRWLSLSLQTGTLVWTWSRHRSKWILIAAAVAFVGTLGWMWIDLVRLAWPEWSILSPRSLVGAVSLLVLGSALAAQQFFQNGADKATQELKPEPGENSAFSAARLWPPLAAAAAALALVPFAIGLALEGSVNLRDSPIERTGYLALLGMLTLLPMIRWRSWSPVPTSTGILISAALAFFALPKTAAIGPPGIVLGQCLSLLLYLAAEAVCRLWPRRWSGDGILRSLAYCLGLILATATLLRIHEVQQWNHTTSVLVLVLLSVLAAATLLWHQRRIVSDFDTVFGRKYEANRLEGRWIVSVTAGMCVVALAGKLFMLTPTPLDTFWVAFAALPILATAWRTRDAVPAAAGGIVLAFSWLGYFAFAFIKSQGPAETPEAIAVAGHFAICLSIAWCLCRSAGPAPSRTLEIFETVLHCAALALGFLFFSEHFYPPTVFFASTCLTLGAMVVAWRLPFHRLAHVAILPVVLMTVRQLVGHGWRAQHAGDLGWWLGLGALLVCLAIHDILLRRGGRLREGEVSDDACLSLVPLLLGTAAVVFIRASTADPWHSVGYVLAALIGAGLGRFGGFLHQRTWASGAAVLSAFAAFRLSFAVPVATDEILPYRIAYTLTAAGILVFGLVLAARRSGGKRTSLIAASVGTLLAFWVFAAPHIRPEKLTTVCWGITAILVFVAGLAGGLRNYRLVGLVGLGLCLIRMFLVDIDDTLYRIIAAFVISAVLLLIAFLYHRFRHLIEVFDEKEGENRDISD